jgi:hypothetical protein
MGTMIEAFAESQMTSDAVLAGSTGTEADANAALWRERGDERQAWHLV